MYFTREKDIKTLIVIAIACFSLSLQAQSIKVNSSDLANLKANFDLNLDDFKLVSEKINGKTFTRIEVQDAGKMNGRIGLPKIPFFHYYLPAIPEAKYNLSIKRSNPKVYSDVLLVPKQPDALEGSKVDFIIRNDFYNSATSLGEEIASLGSMSKLGKVFVQPVTFSPFQYNAAKRELTVWKNIKVRVYTDDKSLFDYEDTHLSSFQKLQVESLVENGSEVTSSANKMDGDTKDVYLVITTKKFVKFLPRLFALHRFWKREYKFEIVSSSDSSTKIKAVIQKHYDKGNLDSVLIFGDETQVKLHMWNSYPGDAWYSFLDGKDYLADIKLGRLPVTDGAEAHTILKKIERHRWLRKMGYVNKNVILAAHEEDYPGKYTANQEVIRKADNKRNLVFHTQYGGVGATNESLLELVNNKRIAILNYRGHGSSLDYWKWDKNKKSFGFDEVKRMKNYGKKLSVVFNIACDTGAIQNRNHTMTEELLFNSGAVAVLASTRPSYTRVNDKFDEYLFRYLQKKRDISLGTLVALSNNKLVRNNGGRVPVNVMMYILFADPLLRPFIK